MNGLEVANKLKDKLQGISGWTGKVYVYIPRVETDEQYRDALVDDDSDEIDVWFIRRATIRSRKYGEAPRTTPLGYRMKQHVFRIRGFQSVYDQGEVLNATSEIDFQGRCDEIEAAFAKTVSLGVTSHDVFLSSVDLDIDMDYLGKALCHVATITLTVEERLGTSYEQ